MRTCGFLIIMAMMFLIVFFAAFNIIHVMEVKFPSLQIATYILACVMTTFAAFGLFDSIVNGERNKGK